MKPNIRLIASKKVASQAARKIRIKRRILLGGPFSGKLAEEHAWIGEVLGKHKLSIVTGGRLGPVNDVIQKALGGKAKNISIIFPGWEKSFNKNIAKKARNIIVKRDATGVRPFHQRLALLESSNIGAYAFLPPDGKRFSGTMLEVHAIVHASVLEATKSVKKNLRPILFIGSAWEPILAELKSSYKEADWAKTQKYFRVIKTPGELDAFVSKQVKK